MGNGAIFYFTFFRFTCTYILVVLIAMGTWGQIIKYAIRATNMRSEFAISLPVLTSQPVHRQKRADECTNVFHKRGRYYYKYTALCMLYI